MSELCHKLRDKMERNILYDVYTDKTIAFVGLPTGSPTYVTLTRVPPKSGPMEGLGKARIRAEYTTTDDGTYPRSASVLDFSNAEKIQRAMQAHSDVATLLFLSLPRLGDIAGSSQAAEPAVVAQVADGAEWQAKVDAAEKIAADLQKQLDTAIAAHRRREEEEKTAKEAAEAKLAAQAGEIGRLESELQLSRAQANQTIDQLKAQLDAAKAAPSPGRQSKSKTEAEKRADLKKIYDGKFKELLPRVSEIKGALEADNTTLQNLENYNTEVFEFTKSLRVKGQGSQPNKALKAAVKALKDKPLYDDTFQWKLGDRDLGVEDVKQLLNDLANELQAKIKEVKAAVKKKKDEAKERKEKLEKLQKALTTAIKSAQTKVDKKYATQSETVDKIIEGNNLPDNLITDKAQKNVLNAYKKATATYETHLQNAKDAESALLAFTKSTETSKPLDDLIKKVRDLEEKIDTADAIVDERQAEKDRLAKEAEDKRLAAEAEAKKAKEAAEQVYKETSAGILEKASKEADMNNKSEDAIMALDDDAVGAIFIGLLDQLKVAKEKAESTAGVSINYEDAIALIRAEEEKAMKAFKTQKTAIEEQRKAKAAKEVTNADLLAALQSAENGLKGARADLAELDRQADALKAELKAKDNELTALEGKGGDDNEPKTDTEGDGTDDDDDTGPGGPGGPNGPGGPGGPSGPGGPGGAGGAGGAGGGKEPDGPDGPDDPDNPDDPEEPEEPKDSSGGGVTASTQLGTLVEMNGEQYTLRELKVSGDKFSLNKNGIRYKNGKGYAFANLTIVKTPSPEESEGSGDDSDDDGGFSDTGTIDQVPVSNAASKQAEQKADTLTKPRRSTRARRQPQRLGQ